MKKLLRRNGWKLLLDLVMAVLLALMYNKRVLGLEFHEIGGLALCGLFIIHKLLNWKWIRAVTTGLFSRRVPVRQKLYWVLDILLLASFAFVLISGIKISKVVFPSSSAEARFKIVHYATAAFALALSGIHVGLHMNCIGQQLKFLRKLPVILRRVTAVVFSIGILVFGSYQLTSTAFLNWIGNLSMVAASTQPSQPSSEVSSELSNALAAVEAAEADVSGSQANTGSVADASSASDTGTTDGLSRNGGGQGLQDGMGPHGNGNQAQAVSVGSVLLSFMSILLLFAVVTAWLDTVLKFFKRKRLCRLCYTPPA
ncbi:MAG: DUF4405 domain-containing protein [Eubacteriales bacterium]|nr:DUF4405 domain-containing protein [Eubacteriales bacterium]